MNSTSITNAIKEAVPRNRDLLAILSETDHAPPALEQQKRYIDDLNNELSTIQKRIVVLDEQRAKEFKEHKKYRDSVMKRFAYRVGGKTDKFQARANKEEQEYFAVLQKERQAKEQEENIRVMRSKALEAQSDLEAEVDRHREAQEQLDSLYDSIFQGPTPNFPEEDRSEQNAESALNAYHNSRIVVETELQVVKLLSEAKTRLSHALGYTEEALSYSRMDMFGGGTFSDFMERNALDKADSEVNQMRLLMRQAQRMSRHVQDLPAVRIAGGSLLGDVLFDNIFSDMAFHEKIKDSRAALERAQGFLLNQLAQAKSRHEEAERDMNNYASVLETSREELQKARQRIFDRVADSNTDEQAIPADDPPPY
ncbi:uncharacterized protein GGS22DRAFT_8788 [Annulohypoxylon maeteangense]|uniref:uncharacterized protein n=1 Tax=Annulohypoxylon maeteangense TaxID=1927788 RepID=UPI0020084555|nr:uncharacterized protein GGS22DRAFT_8788 [Annulohypoxylon maeteangense]KAI0890125.1 hypothetical protein GGS22DRAFT_8788 [Annulohypoxylon maeteangense]